MQKVSKAYKESMKSSLREPGHISISFGLISKKAQAYAHVYNCYHTDTDNDKLFPDCSTTEVFENKPFRYVGTFEQDYLKVDGSMVIGTPWWNTTPSLFWWDRIDTPRGTSRSKYCYGVVSKKIITENTPFTLNIYLSGGISWNALTLDFGEIYPTKFDIISNNETVISVTDNTESKWVTHETFDKTRYLRIKVYEMSKPTTRFRLFSVVFGTGTAYYSDSITDSSLETYVSPIGADVPQIDFSVTLTNYDKYFNWDNPDSMIHIIDTYMEMDVMYGYDTPGAEETEWVQGQHLWCSEWEVDDNSATFRCTDIFRKMDGSYYKGSVYTSDSRGKQYYTLAEEVLSDAGITDYYLDPRLKNLHSKNPMPVVTHREALQIIANACRCILTQSRDGQIQIKSNFTPTITSSATSGTSYSKASGLTDTGSKIEYAAFSQDYIRVDNSMFLLPYDSSQYRDNRGFVSDVISNSACKFTTNPVVTLLADTLSTFYMLKLVFGGGLPGAFTIRTYSGTTLVQTFQYTETDIETTMVIEEQFEECDTIKIEFTKTAKPYNRIVLNYANVDNVADFTMEYKDMTTTPKAVKQSEVKEIVVPWYSYQETSTQDVLVEETVNFSGHDENTITWTFSDPCFNYSIEYSGSTSVSITGSGAYFVTCKSNSTADVSVKIYGYKYKVIETNVIQKVSNRGETITWKNPLISNNYGATALANWLADYYTSPMEYEYSTRGNPELDVMDTIYQENEFCENMEVMVCEQKLKFNGSFSGEIRTRRLGG